MCSPVGSSSDPAEMLILGVPVAGRQNRADPHSEQNPRSAPQSLLPGRLPIDLLQRWSYQADLSVALSRKDRSAIYGGFHLYIVKN